MRKVVKNMIYMDLMKIEFHRTIIMKALLEVLNLMQLLKNYLTCSLVVECQADKIFTLEQETEDGIELPNITDTERSVSLNFLLRLLY